MTTPWEERQILRDIVDGLNAAIAANPLSWDSDDIDPIKLNKLVYLAVDHFDLNVTYRWFKYGADLTKHEPVSVDRVGPVSINSLPSPDTPRLGDAIEDEEEMPPTPRDFKHFFVRELDDIGRIFEDDTRDYLREFYTDYAPEPFDQLYPECAVLQKSLDELARSDDPGEYIHQNADELLEDISRVKNEVESISLLHDQARPFGRFCDLLKDVIVSVEAEDGEVSRRGEQTLRDLVFFFYETAWLLVSLKIASANAEGPAAESWRRNASGRLGDLEANYTDELYALFRQCVDAELIGEDLLEFWPSHDSTIETRGVNEIERQGIDEWSGVGEEVSRLL